MNCLIKECHSFNELLPNRYISTRLQSGSLRTNRLYKAMKNPLLLWERIFALDRDKNICCQRTNNKVGHLLKGGIRMSQKPGEKPNHPGEYEERGPGGEKILNPRQVTIEPGDDRLPPTQESNRTWERIGPPRK
ncbi:YjzC family protein [Salinithrix halophila]|uniref:YjzC family protein n=1 Tax=Salinithrix halophila TaxID=1485204 RepID=A0ABV8JJE8_9BACL